MGGIRVSGSGWIEGRARVVALDDEQPIDIAGFEDGDIIVSRMVPVAWIPYFTRANGFICEVGGWLSHVAIVAREFDVPLIVQAKGLRSIKTGQMIRLHPDGTVEIVQPDETRLVAVG
jgi:phosphohistidine swiveling domain-containing protein